MKYDLWNRCQVCERLIPPKDFLENGNASHRLLTPDAYGAEEKWETLCRNHSGKKAKS
jgi:hypothetical protein